MPGHTCRAGWATASRYRILMRYDTGTFSPIYISAALKTILIGLIIISPLPACAVPFIRKRLAALPRYALSLVYACILKLLFIREIHLVDIDDYSHDSWFWFIRICVKYHWRWSLTNMSILYFISWATFKLQSISSAFESIFNGVWPPYFRFALCLPETRPCALRMRRAWYRFSLFYTSQCHCSARQRLGFYARGNAK